VANVQAVRKALAHQLQSSLNITAHPYMPPTVNPPVLAIIPGSPYVSYGETMGEGPDALGAYFGSEPVSAQSRNTFMLVVLVVISMAEGYEDAQPALDALLEPPGNNGSVPNAIAVDETLGNMVDWAVPLDVATYGQLQIAGQDYFGARIRVQVGA
jgi:hypothetical protein